MLLIFNSLSNSNLTKKNFKNILGDDKIFDLTQFMIDFELDDGLIFNNKNFFNLNIKLLILALIGINWFLVGADPYAIEQKRVKSQIDNCHSLIQKSIFKSFFF